VKPNEGSDNIVVILVATRNGLNIGAAARAMSNFGFTTLRLVRPWEPSLHEAREKAADENAAREEAARSAVGAADLLAAAQVFPSVAEAVADCTLVLGTTAVTAGGRRDLQHPLDRLQESAELAHAHLKDPHARVALLFGSEKTGLTNDDLSHCHRLLRIPTREQHISMNLGQAVAICLYEFVRTAGEAEPPTAPAQPAMALSGEIERLTGMILEALQATGYITPGTEAATEEKLRRNLRRFALTRQDAQLALGMARQILWKLRPPEGR
jgi:TrmH family RNA methyltransferase